MSEELLKRTRGLDAPRPPSAARLAAEALFSVSPPAAAEMPETTVVARRRQPRVADSEASPENQSESESPSGLETRTPRVFRLDPVAPTAQPAPRPEVPELEQSVPLAEGALPARPAAGRRPRKKALRLHGEVTIIRPLEAETPRGGAAELSVDAAPQRASRTDPASSQVRQRRPADTVDPIDDEWPHYPKLLTRIRALEAEAKVLKEREAAQAIKWIRETIATYGFTSKDLGFVDHRRGQAMASGQESLPGVTTSGRRRSR